MPWQQWTVKVESRFSQLSSTAAAYSSARVQGSRFFAFFLRSAQLSSMGLRSCE